MIQYSHQGDERINAALTALASVPEFYALLNRVVRTQLDLLDGELGFVVR